MQSIYFKDLNSTYEDSPCTNKRSSAFKLGIKPVKKETINIWSEWLNCLNDEEQSSRERSEIFHHIRKD